MHDVAIREGTIASHIYLIRGEKVMLDFDLAALYGVETKQLNAVKRNMDRFPADFMFELDTNEYRAFSAAKGLLK